jgi:two-component system OmpR family response regulator
MGMDVGHIVVVDNDTAMRKMLTCFLNSNRMPAKSTQSKAELDRLLSNSDPSLIILDRRLGSDDGFDILRELRSWSDIPVIVMTSRRLDQIDRVIGLELGADDYIVKPFNLGVLLARVRAVLRRHEMGRVERIVSSEQRGYRFDGWKLECLGRRLLDPSGTPISLTKNEYMLLLTLVQAAQRPLTREQLLRATHVRDENSERCIDVKIMRLRRKLEANRGAPKFIRTEEGIGYSFAVSVAPLF